MFWKTRLHRIGKRSGFQRLKIVQSLTEIVEGYPNLRVLEVYDPEDLSLLFHPKFYYHILYLTFVLFIFYLVFFTYKKLPDLS